MRSRYQAVPVIGICLSSLVGAGCININLDRISLAAEKIASSVDRATLVVEGESANWRTGIRRQIDDESGRWRRTVDATTEALVDGARGAIGYELDNAAQNAVGSLGADLRLTGEEFVGGARALVSHELDDAAQRLVASFGSELRFELHFVKDRLTPDFITDFLRLFPRKPTISKVIPDVVDFQQLDDGLDRVTLVGYDFGRDCRSSPRLKLFLLNEDGSRDDVSEYLTLTTAYKAILDLGTSGLQLVPTNRRFVLTWKRKSLAEIPIINTLSVATIRPPHVRKVIPSALDFNLEPDRRRRITIIGNNFDPSTSDRLTLRVHCPGFPPKKVPGRLFIPGTQGALIKLDPDDPDITGSCSHLTLSWDDQLLSEIPIQPEHVTPPTPPVSQIKRETITVPIGALHFVPPHKQWPGHSFGDREFNANGPKMFLHAQARVRNRKFIDVRVRVTAKEWDISSKGPGKPKHDYTYAEGWSDYYVAYVAEEDIEIEQLLSPDESQYTFIDTEHSLDPFNLPEGGLVRMFEAIGDTKGKEAGVRTGVTVYFNLAKIVILRTVVVE